MIRSERVALKQNAKQMIKGKIWRMFLAALIVWGITMVLDMGGKPEYEAGFSAFCSSFFVPKRIVGFLGTFFILPPLMLGLSYLYLDVAGGKDFKISLIFDGFSDFWRVVLMNLLQTIYVFLWGLLLIVPGIIKLISYSQVNFILAENHEISASDALKESKRMMNGHKWEFCVLLLSFIPWGLLFCVTCGVAGIYITPYFHTTLAGYYRKITVKPQSVA